MKNKFGWDIPYPPVSTRVMKIILEFIGRKRKKTRRILMHSVSVCARACVCEFYSGVVSPKRLSRELRREVAEDGGELADLLLALAKELRK